MRHPSRTLVPLLLLLVAAPVSAEPVRVVTTTPTLAAIASAIGGERVDVTSIARPDEDPHFVTPKPSFLVKLRRADLFVQVGMDLEVGWAPTLLRGARNASIQPGGAGHVDASVGLGALDVPTTLTRAEGDVHARGNPHYWLSPDGALVVARNVARGLERVDPAGADGYRAGLARFEGEVAERRARWSERLGAVAGREVVSYHRLWPYLERATGVRFIDQVEPKPGIPPSPRHLAALTETLRSRDVRVLVRAPYSPSRPVEELARRLDGRVVVLPTEPGADGVGPTWLDLFDALVDRLATAFGPTEAS